MYIHAKSWFIYYKTEKGNLKKVFPLCPGKLWDINLKVVQNLVLEENLFQRLDMDRNGLSWRVSSSREKHNFLKNWNLKWNLYCYPRVVKQTGFGVFINLSGILKALFEKFYNSQMKMILP